ncbi:PaaI family thioesterase [Anaerobacillus isosaccharinicus]|uniref:Thioesterase n=1 Tax=Anaerobacillus isosaccharinicus TaxID=1532552 RepID=A0A1S2M7X9_9BACI|nr:PaaI family thioesterase [Anaerobacillus isosaccharinicus]MBA5586764.1 PaaI family thioesterase [Anaerobacillus isosaccharinicus]QOY35018.1 PaaI family thioesterase [Anaerobacillus isosaccharinicus]
MDKEKLREQFEHALNTHQEGTGQLFLYSLLNFTFDYDEEHEVVRIEAPISEMMYNPIGYIHGGIITYMADTAMGHLCAAFAYRPGVSLELKTQFLRAAKTGTLKAEAFFVKKGKQVQFVECDIKDDKDQLLAKTTATFYSLPE